MLGTWIASLLPFKALVRFDERTERRDAYGFSVWQDAHYLKHARQVRRLDY